MIKISIITPVYNNVEYIQACINSFVEQDCQYAEHLIIDGGSTDGTVQVIRESAARNAHIRWISEKDRGQSDAMNKGIRMARGPVISFLNVDDYYEPGVFNRVLHLFGDLPEPSLVVGNCNIWHNDGSLIRVSRPHHLNITDLLMLRGEFPQNPTSYFYHKSLHELIGYYNIEEHFNLDVEFIYNAVQRAKIVRVDEVWGNFRMLKGAKTNDIVEAGDYWKNFFHFRDQYVLKLPLTLRYRYHVWQYLAQGSAWVQKKHRSFQYFKRKLLGVA